MRLEKLVLTNFKGITGFCLAPQGRNATIYGDNATGKTTIMDGYLWLLFGKDSLNRADFEIKMLLDGDPQHGLEHTVYARFDQDVSTLELMKVLTEKWTKKRGAATKEFTGHNVDHFVNGVPVGKREFDAAVASIADEQVFRMLSNPRHFSEHLTWQQRRKILLESFGDVTDQEVISANKKLSPLPNILGKHTLDNYHKILAGKRSEINKELEKIPVRISEVSSSLANISQYTKTEMAALHDALTEAKRNRDFAQAALIRYEAGGETAEKTKQLREIEAKIQELTNAEEAEHSARLARVRTELEKARDALSNEKGDLRRAIETKKELNQEVVSIEKRLGDLRDHWIAVDQETMPRCDSLAVCPTCNQPIPDDQIRAANQKAVAAWNQEKSKRLAAINQNGHAEKAILAQKHEKIVSVNTAIADLQSKVDGWNLSVANLESSMKPLPPTVENLSMIPLFETKDALESVISELRLGNNEAVAETTAKLANILTEIETIESQWRDIEHAKKAEARIEELRTQERTLAKEYEKLEGELYLIEEFIRTKVAMLEANINSKFQITGFKLFEQNINGGVQECCEITYDGVPYGSVNNAARINCGLDVINTLSGVYELTLPVFIDNAEAVTTLLPTSGQMILLVVSPDHKQLEIELEN